jgi:hypothetical protein
MEEDFIRGIFNGGTLPVADLLGQWTEPESLVLLNFLTKAVSILEEKGLYYPHISPETVFVTPEGPKINHPFLFEGFNQDVTEVRILFSVRTNFDFSRVWKNRSKKTVSTKT